MKQADPDDVSFDLMCLKNSCDNDGFTYLSVAFYYIHLHIDEDFGKVLLEKLSISHSEFISCHNWNFDQFKYALGSYFYELPSFPSDDDQENDAPSPDATLTNSVCVDASFEPGTEVLINDQKYTLLESIGRGQRSIVYLAKSDNKDRPDVCIKTTSTVSLSPAEIDQLVNEVTLLKQSDYKDRVVKIFDWENGQGTFYVVMELGEKDLLHYIYQMHLSNRHFLKSEQYHLPKHVIIYIWGEMVYCLAALHMNGVLHLDIKLDNFILVGGMIKLVDLGTSQRFLGDESRVFSEHNLATVSYMAPERAKSLMNPQCQVKIGKRTDIWSLGICLYILLYGRLPFDKNLSDSDKTKLLLNDSWQPAFPERPQDHVLFHSLKRCLTRDYEKRARAEELISILNQ
ncbi:hypothetical protein Ciccas_007871 [Cichlidogyrus casuarinus]|uniref:Protein kinase domain-containing protein n=1 Tax=Cichlidogyrus casuarinus TaxID=1844966 RepID=A0ABD2Q2T0_9PLAT